jgi:glycosyltransferase involved in cell wall biosynthesis
MSLLPQDAYYGQAQIARYAVVVATRDRGAKIVPLIESIRANDEQDFEVVVVDQSSNDETERAIAPLLFDRRIRYVHSSAVGTSRGRNLGVSLTRAPVIVITDDDCIVPSNWLASITGPFEEHPRIGVVFCSVEPVPVDAPGHTPHIIFPANRIVWNVLDVWMDFGKGLSLGAGMAIRRTMFVDVHGFDELLGPGAKFGAVEDNDLSWRGLLRGWATFQCAEVAVIHDGFRPLDEVRALVIRDLYGVGGAIAKYLRAGKWQIAWLLASWLVRFGVILPARELLSGRRPRGFRRPYMLVRGVIDGLRTPIDRADLLYLRNSYIVPR